ncbi:hypothetical protein C8T65DRAFT_744643 [Cerioporus squamosus]|nr:hypothetical protein C8T65DRAFT_744643 [Cerioporus squamosus]
MKYAEHHRLEVLLDSYFSTKLRKQYVTFGALSESEAQDEDLLTFLELVSCLAAIKDLEHESGIKLFRVCPFSKHYHHVLALYTNVDGNERMEELDASVGLDQAMRAIDVAIAEAGIQSEPLWWYDAAQLRGVDWKYWCS